MSFMKRPAAQWVRKTEEDLTGERALADLDPPPRDLVCFHCQQELCDYL
jgi:hypothetical protein